MQIAKLHCIKDVKITGRLGKGVVDHCFFKGKDYYFIMHKKKGKDKVELITIDEVHEVHFLYLFDKYTEKHFSTEGIGTPEEMRMDEVTKKRFERLDKSKKNFFIYI